MPKKYAANTLRKRTKDQLIQLILEWQEAKPPAVDTSELEPVVHGILNDYVGKLTGRKVNGVHPGPPPSLGQVVKEITKLLK